MSLSGIALIAGMLVCLPFCFFKPFAGVLVWTAVAILSPQSYLWGPAATFPWAQVVAVPTIVGFFLFSHWSARGIVSREMFMVAGFWAWVTATSVLSTHTPSFVHHTEATWAAWQYVSKVLLMTVLTVALVDSFARLRLLVMVVAGCFALFLLKAVPFMLLTGGQFRLHGPEQSMIGDNNDFGLALNMTLPIFFFLAQTETTPWLKRLFGFLFIVAIPAVLFTYSRGALTGLAAILLLMLFQLKQRLALVPVLALGAVLALVMTPDSWRKRMDVTDMNAVIDASAQSRLDSWTYAWRLAVDYPITGGGFATFTPELFTYYHPKGRDTHGAHSIYFQVLAEHGFVGLGLYLMLLASCFSTARTLVKAARYMPDSPIPYYANMFRFGLVGFVVSGAFLGRAYFDYFFTIVACLAILKRVWILEQVDSLPEDEAAEVPA